MAHPCVLLTGATGHLGYHLVSNLNERGVVPRALLRREVPEAAWGKLRVEPFPGDLGAPAADHLDRALEGVDTLYHLAAQVSLRPQDAAGVDRVNRLGTMALAEAAARAGVRRIVHVGTAASVGADTHCAPRDEHSPWNLDDLCIPYLQSKRRAEEWLLQWRQGADRPEVVVANPSLLVGPPLAVGRRSPAIQDPGDRRINSRFRGRMLARLLGFYVDGHLNLVDVRDIASALPDLARAGIDGERYLLTGTSVRVRDLIDRASAFYPVGRVRVRLPRRLLLWGATMGAFFQGPDGPAATTTGPRDDDLGPSLHQAVRDGLQLLEYRWEYSIEKAREAIGFHPRPLDESLAHLSEWLAGDGPLSRSA